MQNVWIKEAEKDFVYLAFDIKPADLKQAVQSIKIFNMAGANITVPHKNEVMRYLDYVDKSAEIIGSVNTVVNRNGKLFGYNTDSAGFIFDLKSKKVELKNKNVLVIGAGGASKAILHALAKLKVKKIYITSRTYKTALINSKRCKNAFALEIGKIRKDFLKGIDCVVNASTCGMNKNDKLPFKIVEHNKDIIFYDLIYNKLTPFKKFALKHGLKYFSGEGMLIQQGAAAFKMWTGIFPETDGTLNLLKKFIR